ncbi:MAG: hypothetical protein ACNS60_07535 [Candidatus Cyclobacteriaceae bacterium M2_1C_046]
MNLISIQGHYAPAYYLNKAEAAELKLQVESLTHQHVLVISSKFRTDLIYYGDDYVVEILKLWCIISGTAFKESTKQKFFYSHSDLSSLTHFFYRLHLLYRMPRWHKEFYEQLLSMWMENPKEPALDTLIKITMLLTELHNEHSLILGQTDCQQIIERFVDLKSLTSPDKNILN